MYNPFSLDRKIILITGASSGIGKATAIECSKLGATVIITGRNEERLQSTINELEGNGHQYVVADLLNSNDLDRLATEVPKLDGLVNNAGILITSPVKFIKEEDLSNVIQVNTIAPILLTQRLIKNKKMSKSSSIVFTSSISGLTISFFGNAMYSTSKAAINGFVKNAALELATRKIRVNSVNPGMIKTNFSSDSVSEEQLKEDEATYPLKRYGKPEEVAYSIIYLLSDAAQWVTGTNLIIDGGISLK